MALWAWLELLTCAEKRRSSPMHHAKFEKAPLSKYGIKRPEAGAACSGPAIKVEPETVAGFIENISTKVDELLAAIPRKFRAA